MIERLHDAKMNAGDIKCWDHERVLERDQVLEVRNVQSSARDRRSGRKHCRSARALLLEVLDLEEQILGRWPVAFTDLCSLI